MSRSSNSRVTRRAAAAPTRLELFRLFCLTLTLDNGKPFVLEDWQLRIAEDFLSGVKELHVWVPEGNGKTTFAGALTLFRMLEDPGAVVRAIAGTEGQARSTIYNAMLGFIYASTDLARVFLPRPGSVEIRRIGEGEHVGLKVLPFDAHRMHGENPTLVVVEEMQVQDSLEPYLVLQGKQQKQPDSQLLSITTAGEPDSAFEQMRAHMFATAAKTERKGPRCKRLEDSQYIAWSWALEPDDDVSDLALVKQANPLGQITVETLQEKWDKPGREDQHWRIFACNLPTRERLVRFLSEKEWDAAGVDDAIPPGVPINLGADWGWTEDATALVPAWQRADGTLLLGAAVILAPPRDGNDLSPNVVRDALLALNERNPIEAIAHDASAKGGGHVMSAFITEHLPQTLALPIKPADMPDAAGHFGDELREGRLKHTRDPDLTRHLRNAIRVPTRNDPEKFQIDRPKASRNAPHQRPVREIDAATAALLAVWSVVGAPPANPEPYILTF